MNQPLHNHLRLHSGESIEQMWTDLSRLRRLGVPHDDLPATKTMLKFGLEALATAGVAERSGDLWLWLPAKVAGSEKRHKQAELFT